MEWTVATTVQEKVEEERHEEFYAEAWLDPLRKGLGWLTGIFETEEGEDGVEN